MFELVFLGTSAAAPAVERGSPALYVGRGPERFLVDCGEGTQRQLLRAGLGFRGLRRILLTHAHLDHIAGLAGLVATRSLFGIEEPLEIIGSNETVTFVGRYLTVTVGYGEDAGYRLRAVAAGPVETWSGWRLEAFAIRHRGTQSLAWRFAEDARTPLLPARLAALGVPDGPLRRELAEGRPAILGDGRIVTPDMVRGPAAPGARLVVIGDVEDVAALAAEVVEADTLVVEATYLDRDAALARAHGHLTAAAAAGLAREAGVCELLLTHISGRYPPDEILAEAKAGFANSRIAADFDRVTVRARERPAEPEPSR
jgi:ribonuclease Z